MTMCAVTFRALGPGEQGGLKARDLIAWGEAHCAEPQVLGQTQTSPACKGGTPTPVDIMFAEL
jgi:hypothetical protein